MFRFLIFRYPSYGTFGSAYCGFGTFLQFFFAKVLFNKIESIFNRIFFAGDFGPSLRRFSSVLVLTIILWLGISPSASQPT